MINRLVKPVPAPVVNVSIVFPATNRSFALVVVTAALLVVLELPVDPTKTSNGLARSRPAYSRILMSGKAAATEKATVTAFADAAALAMFLA